MSYAIVTVYDQYEQGIDFFDTKSELNKAVKTIVDTTGQYNQYERYICKIIGMVDYTKKVNKNE